MRRFHPIISPILHDRAGSLILSSAVFVQIGMTYFDSPGWQCPILHATGIPCPGCGLSRATAMLLHGNWQDALSLNALAPVFLFAFFIFAVITFLPKYPRERATGKLYEIEVQTGVSLVFLISLFLYWGVRLAVTPTDFIKLINNP